MRALVFCGTLPFRTGERVCEFRIDYTTLGGSLNTKIIYKVINIIFRFDTYIIMIR